MSKLKLSRISLALLAALAALLALSCNPFAGPLPGTPPEVPVVQQLPYSGQFTYTIDPGAAAHDVYFVFTNPSLISASPAHPSISPDVIRVDGVELPTPRGLELPAASPAPRTLGEKVAEYNRNPPSFPAGSEPAHSVASRPAQNDTVGLSDTFVTDVDLTTGAPTATVSATCRLVRSNVDLGDGRKRSLSVWVDSANWDPSDPLTPPGLGSVVKMSPSKVQALADWFLDSAAVGDIYRWDSAAVGEPWGPHNNSQLIQWDPNATITILLANLNTIYSGAVTVGFFWEKDNYLVSNTPGSNQRIMFYIDATLYGALESDPSLVPAPETTWSKTNYWPETIYSTLAHEFQHMIHFYQKQVLRGSPGIGTDTWINEMCSMVMEDLVADKLGVEGPRGITTPDAGSPGITTGRIPEFNSHTYVPLAVADPLSFGITNYSVAYAFGAWLARNYGGPECLRQIVQRPQTDSSAVVDAAAATSGRAGLTFATLLEEWSAAILLSAGTGAPNGYRLNAGGWTTSGAGAVSYNLGSIDFFNYSPAPSIYMTSSTVEAASYLNSSNTYYQAATALQSSRTWTISLPSGLAMSVIVK